MTRAQARKKGWKLWAPMGGHNPEIDGYLKDGQGNKLDRGFWEDGNGKFVCWDVDFEAHQSQGKDGAGG